MHLLDAINWALIMGPMAYFILVGGLLDGLFVFVFLRLPKYGTAFGEALLANLFSLITGLVAWPFIFPTGFDFAELSMASYGLLWLLTVLSEALVLKLFNRSRSWKGPLTASILMNLLSFIILYWYFWLIN